MHSSVEAAGNSLRTLIGASAAGHFPLCGISPSDDADGFVLEPDLLLRPSRRVPRFFLPKTIATVGQRAHRGK